MARKPKPPSELVQFGATIEDTVVPDGLVRQRQVLAPVKRKLDQLHGEGVWDLEDARRYVARREWQKKGAWEKHLAQLGAVPEGEPTGTLRPRVGQDIEAEVEEIMQQFPDLTEINRPMVRQLVQYNHLLDTLAQRMSKEIAGEGTASARKSQQMMVEIQREVRQIHTTLGLDAGSLRSGGIDEMRQEVMTVMDRSLALLQKHAIRIACPACQTSKERREVNLGYILFHFRQDVAFHFWTVCPVDQCGQGIHITGGPGRPTEVYNGPEHIKPLKR